MTNEGATMTNDARRLRLYLSLARKDAALVAPLLVALDAWGISYMAPALEDQPPPSDDEWSLALGPFRRLLPQQLACSAFLGRAWRRIFARSQAKGEIALVYDELVWCQVFLRVWSPAAISSRSMRRELSALAALDAANRSPQDSQPILRIDLVFAPPTKSLPGATMIDAAHASRADWLAALARTLGVSITRPAPAEALELPLERRCDWRFFSGAGGQIEVAVAGQVVYACGGAGTFAFRLGDGELLWQQPQVSMQGFSRLPNQPVVMETLVYVAPGSETLFALERDSGVICWQAKTEGRIRSVPGVAEGLVVVNSEDGSLRAFEAQTGTLRWQQQIGRLGTCFSAPIISDGVIYTGSTSSHVYAIRLEDGEIVWERLTAGSVWDTLAVGPEQVYVSPFCDQVYALDRRTGAVVWEVTLLDSNTPGPLTLSGDLLLGGVSKATELYALDRRDGAVRWVAPLHMTDYPVRVIVEDETAYITAEASLYVLHLADGVRLWRCSTTDRSILGKPVVADHLLLVVAADGYVYGLHHESK
jgi:outer membrane protein assembly factor BamB